MLTAFQVPEGQSITDLFTPENQQKMTELQAQLADLRADGAAFLLVKTLSDRHPDPGYAQTRAFYRAVGFVPVMDLDIWGPENPALLLVRAI